MNEALAYAQANWNWNKYDVRNARTMWAVIGDEVLARIDAELEALVYELVAGAEDEVAEVELCTPAEELHWEACNQPLPTGASEWQPGRTMRTTMYVVAGLAGLLATLAPMAFGYTL